MDKVIRLIDFKNYHDQAIPIFNKLKILDFHRYKTFTEGKFTWKASNNMLPANINNLFTKRGPLYVNSLKDDFALPNINTEYKRRHISYNGIKTWRQIPSAIREIPSFYSYKRKLKEHLFTI